MTVIVWGVGMFTLTLRLRRHHLCYLQPGSSQRARTKPSLNLVLPFLTKILNIGSVVVGSDSKCWKHR